MKHQLGDAPIQEDYHAQMNALASAIDEVFNGCSKGNDRQVGFVLLAFPFGETEGRCSFICNGAYRKDLICLFKEMIARFEGQPELSGKA